MNKKSGIYKLYWENCEYFYYGQAKDINKRFNVHISNLNKKKHANRIIQNIFEKHGCPKCQVVELCDLSIITEREQFFIDKYFDNEKCCNICPKARTSLGVKRSDETKKKQSLYRTGRAPCNKGIKGIIKQSEETKQKHSNNNKGEKNPFYGKKHSSETKEKLSKLSKTEKSLKTSMENLSKITEEHRRKRLLKIIGRKHTEEAKFKISEAFRIKRELKINKSVQLRLF